MEGLSPPPEFTPGQKLGEGAYGVVHEALRFGKVAGHVMKTYLTNPEHSFVVQRAFWREVNALKAMQDAPVNVPVLVEIIPPNVIIMTDVGDNLRTVRCAMPLRMHHQISDALNYLHDCHILHLDVKPENITERGQENKIYSLIDFGSSAPVGDDPEFYNCTRWYRSPALMLGVSIDENADWWALACCVAESLTGEAIFRGRWEEATLERIVAELGAVPRHLLTGNWPFKAKTDPAPASYDVKSISVTVQFKDKKRSYLLPRGGRVWQLKEMIHKEVEPGPHRLHGGDYTELRNNEPLFKNHYEFVYGPTQLNALPSDIKAVVLEGLEKTWGPIHL